MIHRLVIIGHRRGGQSVLTGDRDPVLAASRPLLRSACFASVAVPVSLAGHVAAGGRTPDAATLLLALTFTLVAHRVVLAARERSALLLIGSLAVAQTGLHLLFDGAAPHGMPAPHAMTADAMTADVTTLYAMAPHATAGHEVATAAVSAGPSPAVMIAAHALAAVVVGWFLREGERVLWSAARRAVLAAAGTLVALVPRLAPGRLAALLQLSLLPARPGPGARSAPVDRHASPRVRHLATGGRFWRGPPRLLLAR